MPVLELLTICVLLSYGCATFNPRPIEEVPFRERAQTKSGGNVRVTAVVLSAEETKEVFDLDLYKRGIQPIWLEIENNDEGRIWFPPAGTDPDYFAPLEVAYILAEGKHPGIAFEHSVKTSVQDFKTVNEARIITVRWLHFRYQEG